jgi:hypothetical protein
MTKSNTYRSQINSFWAKHTKICKDFACSMLIQGSKFALRIRINAKKSEAKRIRIKSLVVRFAFASHFWRIIRINSPKFALFKLTLVKVFLFVFGQKMVVVVIRSSIWPCFCPIMVVFVRILTKTLCFFKDLYSFKSMKIQNFNLNTVKVGVILLTHILIDF